MYINLFDIFSFYLKGYSETLMSITYIIIQDEKRRTVKIWEYQ